MTCILRPGPVVGAAALLLVLAAGCSSQPGAPPMQPASLVPLPPPSADGPVLSVMGEVSWATGHPGCASLRTDNGQTFSLVGPAAASHLGAARTGTGPTDQRMMVRGYVPRVGATVCGASRAFVAQQVTPAPG